MRIFSNRNWFTCIALCLCLAGFSSCLTTKKMDAFVADQYGNQVPKQKKPKAGITVTSSLAPGGKALSTTVHKTNKFLPLLLYWEHKHRYSCSLNPTISVTHFANTVNSVSTKELVQKLKGRQLQLTVEQAPAGFSLVLNEHMIWLIYGITWAKIFIEPDAKDLVVSYKVLQADSVDKTGTITVKNLATNKGLRFFQSWKSATSEHIADYNANVTAMTKAFVTQLTEEL